MPCDTYNINKYVYVFLNRIIFFDLFVIFFWILRIVFQQLKSLKRCIEEK